MGLHFLKGINELKIEDIAVVGSRRLLEFLRMSVSSSTRKGLTKYYLIQPNEWDTDCR